jgi:hypothetical protein
MVCTFIQVTTSANFVLQTVSHTVDKQLLQNYGQAAHTERPGWCTSSLPLQRLLVDDTLYKTQIGCGC